MEKRASDLLLINGLRLINSFEDALHTSFHKELTRGVYEMKKHRIQFLCLITSGILSFSAFPVLTAEGADIYAEDNVSDTTNNILEDIELEDSENYSQSKKNIDNSITGKEDLEEIIPSPHVIDDTCKHESEIVVDLQENLDDIQWLPESHDLAEGYIDSRFYDKSKISLLSSYAGDRLEGPDRNYYDLLSAKIKLVAEGLLSSTIFELPVAEIMGKNQFYAVDLGYDEINAENAKEAAAKALTYDRSKILDALSNDHPYELFWFNKVNGGMRSKYSILYTSSYIKITNIVVSMSVCADYVGDEEYSVDQKKLQSVQTAVQNAQNIIHNAEEMKDVDRLYYYRNCICELTSYNYEASQSGYTDAYGDPWQMVYVFDGNPDTNVVCEGYSKAFQYLMDESDFLSEQIYSFLVTGYMGNAPHMWNIIHMDDGYQYLVDLTNSDSLSTSSSITRFIQAPVSGNVAEGYRFENELAGTLYLYDEDTRNLFTSQELTLSMKDYNNVIDLIPMPKIYSVRAGIGSKATFHVDAKDALSYQWQYSKDGIKWYNSTISSAKTDTITLTVTEKNAGNIYRCILITSDGQKIYTNTANITLVPGVEITKQPKTTVAEMGDKVKFSVNALNVPDGGYRWQYSKDGVHWYNSTLKSATSKTVSLIISDSNKVNKYRCVIIGEDDRKVYSEAAAIIVLDQSPVDAIGNIGEIATFHVKVTGLVDYQWQYSNNNGASWLKSTIGTSKTDTISLKLTEKNINNLYRCKLVTAEGYIGYTKSVKIIK